MPFPWKKAKVTRISRLVADLHQSPKRGRSLVVETGFPTSLIDLFVKNRDRLRKSPKRKSSPPQIQTPLTHLSSSPPQSFTDPPCNQEPQIDVGKLVLVQRECEERIAFHTAFKIFLLVALAVSTRNLALWIMMAAFLLVLIEFVGTSFFGFLRPKSKTFFLDSWIGKGFLVLKKWDWERESSAEKLVCGLIESEDDCVEEIQILKSKSDCVGVGKGCESLETRSEILICKSERSRSGRIKRNFIKRFVPKKLRHGKKDQLGGDIHKVEEIEEEKQGMDDDGDRDGIYESQKEEEESCKEISTCDQQLWVENISLRKGKSKSGHLILIMFVIVLGGLIGGRGVALLLTLVWCFILTYIGRLSRC